MMPFCQPHLVKKMDRRGDSVVKNPPAKRETQVHSRSGRSPGEGNGNPFLYSGLENPMEENPDRL